MKDRLTQQDIADYALNELDPRERLYVESMMLGSEALREDACAMIDTARLLELGFESEVQWQEFSLDESRRKAVLEHFPSSVWQNVGKVAATAVGLAACVAFSVAAPVVWNLATHPGGSSAKAAAPKPAEESVSAVSVLTQPSDSGLYSFQVSSAEDLPSSSALLPTGAVGFMEMPLPSLSIELN
jgi:hypothetical protein